MDKETFNKMLEQNLTFKEGRGRREAYEGVSWISYPTNVLYGGKIIARWANCNKRLDLNKLKKEYSKLWEKAHDWRYPGSAKEFNKIMEIAITGYRVKEYTFEECCKITWEENNKE